MLLKRVSANTPEIALLLGRYVFDGWLRETDTLWRSVGRAAGAMAEWSLYQAEADTQGVCRKKDGPLFSARNNWMSWESMMEPPPSLPPSTPMSGAKLLARAPARLWNGLFSVRISVSIGNRNLVGRFLLDSGARVSLISPLWLESQGVVPFLLEIPASPQERVNWTQDGQLARRARVDRAEMSGYKLPFREFLVHDTEYFTPPENASTCCDGVLGLDFFRHVVAEFVPGPHPEVRLWSPEGFAGDASLQWFEAAVTPQGEVVSSCLLNTPSLSLPGVKWDTASEYTADISKPWQNRLGKGPKKANLLCNGKVIHPGLPLETAEDPATAANPAATIGMGFLGHGHFTLDLPHGRLWLAQEIMQAAWKTNRSGLEWAFSFENGERVLRVKRVIPGTPAAKLVQAGLREGTLITEVDGSSAGSLDLWEINRRLMTHQTEKTPLLLRWKGKTTEKTVPLPLE